MNSQDLPPAEDVSAGTLDQLFVYGSLHNDQYFQILTGRTFAGQTAELLNHRRVQPRNSFAFAIPWSGSKIPGKLLSGVTPEVLRKLDEYENEGSLYSRCVARVKTQDQVVEAYVYVGNPKALKTYFKKGFLERDRIEEFVARQVDRYLEFKADRCLLMDRKNLALMVTRELLSEEVESLLHQHFMESGLPSFIIKHEIESANLPSLEWLLHDRKAQRYTPHYMALAVKFMIFNQLEERFRNQYRGSVKTGNAYYHHTIPGLMALKLMGDHKDRLSRAMSQLGVTEYQEDMRYIDYTVAAVMIAEELYTHKAADEVVYWVRKHRQIGINPLGAEMEFSNLGGHAISARENQDPCYDSFFYFHDFDLMRRGWKLGAHVDDHGFQSAADMRSRGFLELAFGRYRLLSDVSKPATQDPWILAQIIQWAVDYIDVAPHSLHVSIETLPDRQFNKLPDPNYFLCLLLLGGDLTLDDQGKLREMRIYHEEILHPDVGVCLSRLNRHHQNPQDRRWSSVVEFQFPRLFAKHDYQPLLMALKGFQMAANPFPFKGVKDCPYQEEYAEIEAALIQWAAYPTAVATSSLNGFIDLVTKGLAEEAKQCSEEYEAYSSAIMQNISTLLHERNSWIADYHTSRRKPMADRTLDSNISGNKKHDQ
jgi:gamma-glutamylcyclotransferase (GGCT)/AIG2-like uncharacterized protein YtfP